MHLYTSSYFILLIFVSCAGALYCFLNIVSAYHTRLRLIRKNSTPIESRRYTGMMGFMKPVLEDISNALKEHATIRNWIHSFQKKYDTLLMQAGSPGGFDGFEFYVLKLLMGLLVLGCAQIVGELKYIGIGILCGAIGYYLPDLWLKEKIHKRVFSICSQLPDAIDNLTLLMQAGLDLSQALENYIAGADYSDLQQEFYFLLRKIRLGKSRLNALEEMGERIKSPEVQNFVSAIVMADKTGVSAVEFLTQIAEDMRIRRFNRAEEVGQKAPIKLLFPMIVFNMPCVFLILFGPLLINILQKL
jgi:tight adherence protein C